MIDLAALLPRLFRSQAYRELGSARLFEAGLPFAPDPAVGTQLAAHAAEERHHHAAVMALWTTWSRQPAPILDAQVEDHLATHPLPVAHSWLDLAMARFLFDRAGAWQLREYQQCAFVPYQKLAKEILADEDDHMTAGVRDVEILAASANDRHAAHEVFSHWLRPALLSFGRPGSPASQRAVALGLKRRDPASVMQDFIDDIRPGVKAAGFAFPPPDSLHLDLPRTLRW